MVPDGAFNLVPLAALPSGRGRYLVEDGPIIHYLSAERDLVLDEAAGKPSSAGLLSVGGAAFSDGSSFATLRHASPPQGAVARANLEPAARSLRDASVNCGGFRSMRLARSRSSRNEAQAVAGLWRQFGAGEGAEPATLQTLIGAAATELAFKQAAPGRRILHLATHGFFLGDECGPIGRGRSRGRRPDWSCGTRAEVRRARAGSRRAGHSRKPAPAVQGLRSRARTAALLPALTERRNSVGGRSRRAQPRRCGSGPCCRHATPASAP